MCPCTLGATRVPTSQAAAPPSCSSLTGAELPQTHTPKKGLVFMHAALLRSCPARCDPVDGGLPDFLSDRQEYWRQVLEAILEAILQARILERIGQYWFPYTSRALYFQLP